MNQKGGSPEKKEKAKPQGQKAKDPVVEEKAKVRYRVRNWASYNEVPRQSAVDN